MFDTLSKRGESMKNILHNIIESIDDEDILKNILFHHRTKNVIKQKDPGPEGHPSTFICIVP